MLLFIFIVFVFIWVLFEIICSRFYIFNCFLCLFKLFYYLLVLGVISGYIICLIIYVEFVCNNNEIDCWGKFILYSFVEKYFYGVFK